MGFFGGRGNGYKGQSMSVNAVNAYDDGEMPLSKWTKSEILDRIKHSYGSEIRDLARKATLQDLRDLFLYSAGYHHTGKYYNVTYFYGFDEDLEKQEAIEKLSNRLDFNKDEKLKKKMEPKVEKPKPKVCWVYAQYDVWSGTRKHPKKTQKTGVGTYTEYPNGNKSLVKLYDKNGSYDCTKQYHSIWVYERFAKKPAKNMKVWKKCS